MRSLNEKKMRIVLLTAAVLLIGIGILQDGHVDVLNKAIRLCYECIGIG